MKGRGQGPCGHIPTPAKISLTVNYRYGSSDQPNHIAKHIMYIITTRGLHSVLSSVHMIQKRHKILNPLTMLLCAESTVTGEPAIASNPFTADSLLLSGGNALQWGYYTVR